MADTQRPTEPILDGDLRDPKIFYHNAAYKTNRVAINLEKMKASFWSSTSVCKHHPPVRC